MVAYSVVILLIVVDSWLALAVAVVIGGMYALIFDAVRGILGRAGRDLAHLSRFRSALGHPRSIGGTELIQLPADVRA